MGNRGTDIDNGLSLLMDTDGPAIRRIVIEPATPIKNSTQSPVTVHVTIGLTEAVADGTAPVLDYLLSGPGRGAINIPVLTQILLAHAAESTTAGRCRPAPGRNP